MYHRDNNVTYRFQFEGKTYIIPTRSYDEEDVYDKLYAGNGLYMCFACNRLIHEECQTCPKCGIPNAGQRAKKFYESADNAVSCYYHEESKKRLERERIEEQEKKQEELKQQQMIAGIIAVLSFFFIIGFILFAFIYGIKTIFHL